MPEPTVRRAITISVDPAGRSARVEVPSPARPAPFVIAVRPDAGGDGWVVADPTDPEPTWRQTFEAALSDAITQAGRILAEWVDRELVQDEPASPHRVRQPADIC